MFLNLIQGKFVRFSRMAAICTATASLSLVSTVSPSTAAQVAPSCVRASLNDTGYYDYLTVTNTCRTTQRVKVVIANLPDYACTSVAPNRSFTIRWGYPGRFDRLESC